MEVTNGAVSPEELAVLEPLLAGVSRDEVDWKVFELICRNYLPWRCAPLLQAVKIGTFSRVPARPRVDNHL